MTKISDPERLEALLGVPPLGRLRSRLRQRLMRFGILQGRVLLSDPTREERVAVDGLFGRSSTSGKLWLHLGELEQVLRKAGICSSLVDAIEHLEGPLLAIRQASLEEQASWEKVEKQTADLAAAVAPWARDWQRDVIATGLLRRMARGSATSAFGLFTQALKVLLLVPMEQARIAELAAEVCGDSHGLDEGEPLGTIVLRGLEHALQLKGLGLARAELLARAGILVDDISSTILALNLRASSTGLLARTLAEHTAAGEPLHFSLRALRREGLAFSAAVSPMVFACENPTVLVAAADALGPACPPLICTNGQPRSGVRETLRRLNHGGVRVIYHGDFDWPGINIALGIFSRGEALPWRFSAEDYAGSPDGGPLLAGKRVETPWDVNLAPAMESRGIAVHEEAVLPRLLADLRGGSPAEQRS